MTAGKQIIEADMVRVARLLEVGKSRREIARETGLALHAVQACADRAAVWWLQGWRVRRAAEDIDRLADPH